MSNDIMIFGVESAKMISLDVSIFTKTIIKKE